MKDDFSARSPGFVQRDNLGRKMMHLYASERDTLVSQHIAIEDEIRRNEGAFAHTLEGRLLIVGVGHMEYAEHGWHTENLLGHRVQWRMQIFLGKALRPPTVKGYTADWLFQHA